uniref:DeoR family transcriptional regulator n=1 Tax=Clostridium sp. NkU-1 TaxID=1095009 RepID=UPI0006D0769C
MRISRIDQLEQYILEHKAASNDVLCEEFEISKNTLRRDLEILVARGSVEKVYGASLQVKMRPLSRISSPSMNVPAEMPKASRESPHLPLPMYVSGISYSLTAGPPP